MRASITQQNLYLILAGKAAAVAAFIAEDEHISPLDALTKFYASDTYRRLERAEITGIDHTAESTGIMPVFCCGFSKLKRTQPPICSIITMCFCI